MTGAVGRTAVPGPGPDLGLVVGAFGHLLHAAGVPVTPERSARLVAAVLAAAPATTDELYWLGRVTLLSDVSQVAAYDAVFGQVFRGLADVADSRGDTSDVVASPHGRDAAPPRDAQRPVPGGAAGSIPSPSGPDERDESGERTAEVLQVTVSARERLRGKDFGAVTVEELVSLRELIAALPVALPQRTSRRSVRSRRGRDLDVRATLRASRRTGADPVRWSYRTRRQRPRRLVLIADVSGSMEAYVRPYLYLLHAAVRSTRAEAFVFSTRLTRLTRALAGRDPDQALARAARAAPDWSGGTRIGMALRTFNEEHGRRGAARGAVVVIVSDGWDTDAPSVVGEQLARTARLAHRIVWVNPRKASARYEPLAGAMAAALPHVDAFVSGHSLAALDEVLAAIAEQ